MRGGAVEEGQAVRYDHDYLLYKLAEVRAELEAAQADLRHWIGVAQAEGLPKTAISDASGVSRVTINRWTKEG